MLYRFHRDNGIYIIHSTFLAVQSKNRQFSPLKRTKTDDTQPKLSATCFVIQSCQTDDINSNFDELLSYEHPSKTAGFLCAKKRPVKPLNFLLIDFINRIYRQKLFFRRTFPQARIYDINIPRRQSISLP